MKLIKYIKNPYRIFPYLAEYRLLKFLPDRVFLRLVYRGLMSKKLDLNNPTTYNEKLQWLKLNDFHDFYTDIVDKYEVRKFVESKIGDKYLTKLFGVWSNFDEIDISKLPNSFVLKCTHDSGGVLVCKDKGSINLIDARKKFNKAIKKNFFDIGRELPYKKITPRIICEELLTNNDGSEIMDFKFFCFHGVPKFMYIASDRSFDTKFDFFDLSFKKFDLKQYYPNSNKPFKKPDNFDEMIDIARKLSVGFPHVRIDLYNVNNKIYFGEITFYHLSGFKRFKPDNFDYAFGEYINLDRIKVKYVK